MKIISILVTLVAINFSIHGQGIFTEGSHMACNSDSIFKNSPMFNESGTPPKNSNEVSILDYFQKEIGKIKTSNKRVVFKFVLDCEGQITDVWVFKSTGEPEVDSQILALIKELELWEPASFQSRNVDFEMTLMGAVKNGKLYLGTQMNPPKEWSDVN